MKMKTHYRVILFLILTFSIIVGPIIINGSYKVNNGYLTLWEAKDMLAYFGTIVSTIGTIFIGIIAFQNSKETTEINKRLLKIEQSAKKGILVPQTKCIDNGGNEHPFPHKLRNYISFVNIGNDNIYVRKTSCSVNHEQRDLSTDQNLFVCYGNSEFSSFLYEPKLHIDDLQNAIEIIIEFDLVNSLSFEYTQHMVIGFSREANLDEEYYVCKFNTEIIDPKEK